MKYEQQTQQIDKQSKSDLYIDICVSDVVKKELNKLYNENDYRTRKLRKYVSSKDASSVLF